MLTKPFKNYFKLLVNSMNAERYFQDLSNFTKNNEIENIKNNYMTALVTFFLCILFIVLSILLNFFFDDFNFNAYFFIEIVIGTLILAVCFFVYASYKLKIYDELKRKETEQFIVELEKNNNIEFTTKVIDTYGFSKRFDGFLIGSAKGTDRTDTDLDIAYHLYLNRNKKSLIVVKSKTFKEELTGDRVVLECLTGDTFFVFETLEELRRNLGFGKLNKDLYLKCGIPHVIDI